MNCSKCRQPMRSGEQDGKPVMACLPCSSVIQLPLAGATTPHSAKARVQTQGPMQKLPSDGEVSFAEAWRDYVPSLPFETEYKFHNFREWRLDFAWPEAKVAVEMESSVHRTKGRFEGDLPKYNALSADFWLLFRCTRSMIEKDAERFCRMVKETIRKRLAV